MNSSHLIEAPRLSRSLIRGAAGAALLLLAFSVGASPALAQVGYPPSKSPYRDILYGTTITAMIGHIGGDGGKLRVGAHNGLAYGARFDVRLSTPLQVGAAVTYANLERFIVDADDSVASRVRGPVDQRVILAEAALQWNITGKKTWHRLAPYVGLSLGLAFGSDTPSDTSGYRFGNKFFAAPNLGVRAFLTDRLHIRAEARQIFWKLKYPSRYLDEPEDQPGTGDDSNAVITDGKLEEWTGGRHLFVGLGYALSF